MQRKVDENDLRYYAVVMNYLDAEPLTTRAADGVARRAFTVDDVERMVEVGLIGEDERLEIIGGEIVPMSPKGNRHEVLRMKLINYWAHAKPKDITMGIEPGWRLNKKTYVEPDFVFFPTTLLWPDVKPSELLLLVEISDTSLTYDQTTKAQIYASFGVRELWVINAMKLTTRIHRDPAADGYRDVKNYSPQDMLTPIYASSLAVTLGELEML